MYNYNIYDIIKIQSELSTNFIPQQFFTSKLAKPDLKIRKLPRFKSDKFSQIGPGMFCADDEKLLIYTPSFLGFEKIFTLGLKNLSGVTEIYVNRLYEKISKIVLQYPISGLLPIQDYIKAILHVKLLLKQHTFVIGACIKLSSHEDVLLVSSHTGLGKTTAILKLAKQFGFRLLSDDTTIVNDSGRIFGYPQPVKFRVLRLFERYVKLEDMLKKEQMLNSCNKPNIICLLERYKHDGLRKLEINETLAKLLTVNRKLLPYYSENTIMYYPYVDPSFDLYALMEREEKILEKMVSSADCYILEYTDISSCVKFLTEVIKKYG